MKSQPAISLVVYGEVPFPSEELTRVCRPVVSCIRSNGKQNRVCVETVATDLANVGPVKFEFAFVPYSVVGSFIRIIKPHLEPYEAVVKSCLSSMRALRSPLTEARIARDEQAHILVAGLLADLGVGTELLHRGVLEKPAMPWVWAFQGGTCAHNSFGIRIWKSPRAEAELAQLWHRDTKRNPGLQVDDVDISLLKDCAEADRVCSKNMSDTSLKRLIKMHYFQLVRKSGAYFNTNIPVVQRTNDDRFLECIRSTASELVDCVMLPASEVAMSPLRGELPFGKHFKMLNHAFFRLFLEHIADRLIETGLLPSFPAAAKGNWATWLST
jgi:hypothetical protein